MTYERPWVAPADIYARYEKSNLVRYPRDEVLAALAEIDVALAEREHAEQAACELLDHAKAADIAQFGPDPLWDAYVAETHPELSKMLAILDKAPSNDWGGTGRNCYPVKTWLQKVATIRRYAARLMAAVENVAGKVAA